MQAQVKNLGPRPSTLKSQPSVLKGLIPQYHLASTPQFQTPKIPES